MRGVEPESTEPDKHSAEFRLVEKEVCYRRGG